MSSAKKSTDAALKRLFDVENYLYFCSDLFMSEEQTHREAAFLIQHLGIGQKSSILDLACGNGRHTHAIGRFARSAVGLDMNMSYIKAACKTARAQGLTNTRFEQKDIRRIDFKSKFSAAMMVSTVFGIFTDEDNANLLRSVGRALTSRGLFCFDIINRDTLLADFTTDFIFEKEGNFLLDRCSFDPQTGTIFNNRLYIKNGRTSKAAFSIRTYNYTEIASLLKTANFSIKEVFSDWHGTSFDWQSKKIVIVAQKQT